MGKRRKSRTTRQTTKSFRIDKECGAMRRFLVLKSAQVATCKTEASPNLTHKLTYFHCSNFIPGSGHASKGIYGMATLSIHEDKNMSALGVQLARGLQYIRLLCTRPFAFPPGAPGPNNPRCSNAGSGKSKKVASVSSRVFQKRFQF